MCFQVSLGQLFGIYIYIDDIFSFPFDDSSQSRSQGGQPLLILLGFFPEDIYLFTIIGNKYTRRKCRFI